MTQRQLPPGTRIQIKFVATTNTRAAGCGPLPGRPVTVRRRHRGPSARPFGVDFLRPSRPETKFPTSRKLSADESAAANCDPLKSRSVLSNRVERRRIKTDLCNPLGDGSFVSHRRRRSFGSTNISCFKHTQTHIHTFQLYRKRRLINRKNSVIIQSAWC